MSTQGNNDNQSSAERGQSASVVTPQQLAALLQSFDTIAQAAMQNMNRPPAAAPAPVPADLVAPTAVVPAKMPYPSDKNAQIWKGEAETLNSCILWFERTAKEKKLPEADYTTKWFDYVQVGFAERLRLTLAEFMEDWEAMKQEMYTSYPDRAKLIQGSTESLKALADYWTTQPLVVMEDLTLRKNAYSKEINEYLNDDGSSAEVDKFWFCGMPLAWQAEYDTTVHRHFVPTTGTRKRYPTKKTLEDWLKRILDPTDEVHTAVIEKLNPGIKTHQQRSIESEMRKTKNLSKIQQGKADIIAIRPDNSMADYDNFQSTWGGLPNSTLADVKPVINEVDTLVNDMSQLKVQSVTSAHDAAAYRRYYTRLLAISPVAAQAFPMTIQDTPVVSIATLLAKVGDLQMRYRNNYQDMPEYRSAIATLQTMHPVVAQAVQGKTAEVDRQGQAPVYSKAPRDLPPHFGTPNRVNQGYPGNNAPGGNNTAGPGNDRRCHFCGGSDHYLRNCPEADKMGKLGAIVQENGFWVWADTKRRITRHRDGTYGSTVKELWQHALDNMQTAKTVNQLASDYIPFEQSMYDDGEESDEVAYTYNTRAVSTGFFAAQVVDDNGDPYQGTLLGMPAVSAAQQGFRCASIYTDPGEARSHTYSTRSGRKSADDDIVLGLMRTMRAMESTHTQDAVTNVVTRSQSAHNAGPDQPSSGTSTGSNAIPLRGWASHITSSAKTTIPSKSSNPVTDRPAELARKVRFHDTNVKESSGTRWSPITKAVNSEDVLSRLILDDGIVTLKIGELCAISEPYRKRLSQMTRNHRGSAVSETNYASPDAREHQGNSRVIDGHFIEEIVDSHSDTDSEADDGLNIRHFETSAVQQHSFGAPDDDRIANELLAVSTSHMKVAVEGVPMVALVDSGSELNVMPLSMWEEINNETSGLARRTDTIFHLNGVIGKGEELHGHAKLNVTLGGITTQHIFWIGESVKTLILGEPFIYKNKVEVIWKTDDRRALRQRTSNGVTEQWVDGPNGIQKTYYDPRNPTKVISFRPPTLAKVQMLQVTHMAGPYHTVGGEPVAPVAISLPSPPSPTESSPTTSPRTRFDFDLALEIDWLANAIAGQLFSTIPHEDANITIDLATAFLVTPNTGSLVDQMRAELQSPLASCFLRSGAYKTVSRARGWTTTHLEEVDERVTPEFEVAGAYKSVLKKKRPVETQYPESEKRPMKFPEDILADLPQVPTQPLPRDQLQYGERVTKARIDEIWDRSLPGFLTETEKDVFTAVLLNNEMGLAWTEEEKGSFRTDCIPPQRIPLVPHAPWQDKIHRIPAKTREKVIDFLKGKLKYGLYERSQSSYRSAFFPVAKKDGNIRIVHDLQHLNEVTVRDAGVPPNMDDLTEDLAGCSVYTGLDAFAGYDQLEIDVESRDVTSFESPLGTLRLTKMPQGWTNAVAVFHRVMGFIFADEYPTTVQIYIDDVTVKGPKTFYADDAGRPETIPQNSQIRRFIYEHACDLNKVLHKMKRFGGTFSAKKLEVAVKEIKMVGFMCSHEGRRVTHDAMAKVEKWTECRSKKDVRSILGILGRGRIWIKGYGDMVRPLVELTKSDGTHFEWPAAAAAALEKAKEAFLSCGVIRPVDYSDLNKYPIIVAVDASQFGCGIELAQMDSDGRRRIARCMSVYYNETQQRYGQAKLELFGVFVALKIAKPWIHGCKFILETDCSSVKQMITGANFPSAAESRWCAYIQLHHFEFRHIPGTKHEVADALSRRPHQVDDSDQDSDFGEILDATVGMTSHGPFQVHVLNGDDADDSQEDSDHDHDANLRLDDEDRLAEDRWDGQPMVNNAYMRAPLGMTPYKALYGQECVLPIDFTLESMLLSNWRQVESETDLLEARMKQMEKRPSEMAEIAAMVKSSRNLSVEYHNEKNEKRQQNRNFKPGDFVLIRNSQQDNGREVRRKPRWRGPFRIVRVNQGGRFVLSEATGRELKEKIPGSRVRKFFHRPAMMDIVLGREEEADAESD
ncbi:hypothetical protein B9479_008086 [Cryptococcus floricola]|uniref:RNA-directed DNA polymerase n=1 Tax=Cryptococcus floricola TaxID=2591691 RepID=A0A5D3AK18_9TREE|nr:hypothetical protein B9479_008086 [Cryptococcus floricola]